MFMNYVLIALRNIKKNKLYAAINVFGLAIGLCIYVMGALIIDYENNHDRNWAYSDRIYTVGSVLSQHANIGVDELDNTYTVLGPLIANDMADDVEAVARTVRRGYVVSHGDKLFSEIVRFADPELLQIFDFTYLYGDVRALNNTKSAILTRDQAVKMFGSVEEAMGKVILLNSKHDMTVTAIIENMPVHSHFNGSITDSRGFDIIAPVKLLSQIANWNIEGNWNNISSGNRVYVLTKNVMSIDELTRKLNGVFDKHATEDLRENFMKSLKARNIKDTNNAVWEMIGTPVPLIVKILSIFVLTIAIVNYTNLSAAQGMGRVREVGMRKTLGAGRVQLLSQFLIESITIASIAMVISLVSVEMIMPMFNEATGKAVVLNYGEIIGWLVGTTIIVGIIAGLYPAYLITGVNPIEALKQLTVKGGKGNLFRSVLIGFQFMLSTIILGAVLVMHFQNQKMINESDLYPKDQVLVVERLSKQDVRDKEDVLRREIEKIEGVERVTFASQVPFEQSNSQISITKVSGDTQNRMSINTLYTDHNFLKTFDIKLLAGRDFSKDISADYRASREDRDTNVIINKLLLDRLGYASPEEALGQTFYGMPGERATFQYTIIGVIENKKILGAQNELKSWIFQMDWDPHFFAGIRIQKGASADVITRIEDKWREILPQYPFEHTFLNDMFNSVFEMINTMHMAITGFAVIALSLALIGLFGMAAFMARGRTKEVGVRKVLGAEKGQLIRLLVWQFTKPIMWSLLIATPLSFWLTNNHLLAFYSEPIDMITAQVPLILCAGVLAVILSWGIVSIHALRVARSNPIKALRYE